MDIFRYILWIWAFALFIGGIIPLFHSQIWWLRAWTYSRLQMLALSVLTIAVTAMFFGFDSFDEKAVLVACVTVIGLCLRDILRFTPLGSKQTKRYDRDAPHIPISLLVGNVLQDNETADGLLRSIENKDPDFVFLCETNSEWRQRLSELENRYAHKFLMPLEDYNGMLFYSKFPIKNVQERYLVQDHIPSLCFDIDVGQEETLRLYGVHPRPPRPEDDTEDLDHELVHVANEVGNDTGPVIVTGDLNDVGWSKTTKTFLKTSGLLDPRRGRGLYNSFNAKNPLIRWPLDHVFHSDQFALIEMKRLPKFGSDHFPIYVKLALNT